MTQHPADTLVEKVADAIAQAFDGRPDLFDPINGDGFADDCDRIAQAAMAAVREGHVVVPMELFDRLTMACMVAMNYAPNSDAVGLERTAREADALTQHDGAKDAE